MELRNNSIQYIKGIGPKKAKYFNKLGIQNLHDLLHYFPRSYQDRSNIKYISQLVNGESAVVEGVIATDPQLFTRSKKLTYIKIIIRDITGSLTCTWFNMPYIKNNLGKGDNIRIFGKITKNYGVLQVTNPEYEIANKSIGENQHNIFPVYSLTQGVTNKDLSKAIKKSIESLCQVTTEPFNDIFLKQFGLLNKISAIKNIHFPTSLEIIEASRKRLAFDELFYFQVHLQKTKSKYVGVPGICIPSYSGIVEFIDSLPFRLTNAQSNTFKEVESDLASGKIMNRLIQGDVGSGKTIIAVLALLQVVKSGYQGAIMVPTEILAEQHYITFKNLMKNIDVRIELLVGSQSKVKKTEIIQLVESGNVDILIGTHALIEDAVNFNKLALVVTDEQHRFGVRQRSRLAEKGQNPHIMIMTATPIPRTLALIMYGDLDVSVIDQLPPGRKKVNTYSVDGSFRERVYSFLKKQLQEGRQGYIVCPLIEDSELLEVASLDTIKGYIDGFDFSDYKIEILHGKVSAVQKEEIMKRFRDGQIQVLISTTVIEVGINVPNSSVMIIENAERFGLAQLHQLRGRVGRGEYQSYCILINDGKSQNSKERMKIMERYTDGFKIAEKDMELRGPGEFFGTRQHGQADFKIANLFTDLELLKLANNIAQQVVLNKNKEYIKDIQAVYCEFEMFNKKQFNKLTIT